MEEELTPWVVERLGAMGLLIDSKGEIVSEEKIRTFDTGATRDADTDKPDYEGFLSPEVLAEYARYMHENRKQSDGKLRASDNWKKGIPKDEYMKSMWRHFMDVWGNHRASPAQVPNALMNEALCALLFNVMGYMYEELIDPALIKDNAIKEVAPGIIMMTAGKDIKNGQLLVVDTENGVAMPVEDTH